MYKIRNEDLQDRCDGLLYDLLVSQRRVFELCDDHENYESVGDKVRVKDGLVVRGLYNGVILLDYMLDYMGKELTIQSKFSDNTCFLIEDLDCVWGMDMLEGVK